MNLQVIPWRVRTLSPELFTLNLQHYSRTTRAGSCRRRRGVLQPGIRARDDHGGSAGGGAAESSPGPSPNRAGRSIGMHGLQRLWLCHHLHAGLRGPFGIETMVDRPFGYTIMIATGIVAFNAIGSLVSGP